jgi:3-hydroxymyristoyl/3-hydroxydecanoyl-(acyl carrier protein) dehydratase
MAHANLNLEELEQRLASRQFSRQWPQFSGATGEQSESGSELHFDLLISSELSYFAGHFPQQAVLPGVVQVHWAVELTRQYLQLSGFAELRQVKFSNMILPECAVRLSLKQQTGKDSVRFRYSDQIQQYSSGSIYFRDSE